MPFGECAREHMQEFDLESMLNIIDLISKQKVNCVQFKLPLGMMINVILDMFDSLFYNSQVIYISYSFKRYHQKFYAYD